MDENELRRLIGKRLRLARYTAELTQDQLGDAAGVSRSFICLIERGAPGVDVYRLRRLALAAGTTLAALLDEGTASTALGEPSIHSGQKESTRG